MPQHLVIGLGSIGTRHHRLLQEAGEEVHGVDKEFLGFNLSNMNLWKNLDMVWICTPESEKERCLKMALREGKKVFIEKPFAGDYNGDIWIACNLRFHPAVQVLKDNLHLVGDILYSRLHYSHYLPYQRDNWKEYIKTTDILLDAGWHYVDVALWLFGKGNGMIAKPIIKEWDFEYARIGIRHNNDIFTSIDVDWIRRDKSCGATIVGTDGTLIWLSTGKNPETASVIFKTRDSSEILFAREVDHDEMYRNQMNYLLSNNWTSNLDEAKEVMRICKG